jgi:phage/conjugal plasmid C-4 type zinc finger TraR family protein
MDDNINFMNNMAEEELGQLHAIHVHLNAIADVRRQIKSGPGLSHCVECGDEIPAARQLVIPGVETCVYCQSELENSRSLA